MLTRKDWFSFAEKHDLTLLSEPPPIATWKAEWECNLCHRRIVKSYRQLSENTYVCRCRSKSAKVTSDYHTLAEYLGIDFVAGAAPNDIHIKTLWKNRSTGVLVEASYHQLAYSYMISNRLKEALGIQK